MRRRFHTLDVFTEEALAGNPLAVVHDGDGLDPARMQAVAREFNLAETVFVLHPRDPVNSARIRIFTPSRELPFAGHPTVGTAVLLGELRAPEIVARQDLSVVIEEEIGPVLCTARRVRGRPRASFTLPRLPAAAGEGAAAGSLARAFGLDASDVGFDRHRPAVLSAGLPFQLLPLASAEAVDRARADPARWAGPHPVYLYARHGDGFYARMIPVPAPGAAEDPATGSAAAALAGAVMAFDAPGEGDHTVPIRQGVAMGRPSLIWLGLEVEGGALVSASIGGGAVVVSEGTIDL